ncbi:BRCA1-A complex subunit RAP80-like isoform X1 [Sinocyclocheilus rhinocerous]|uniref:BRCA1-A complex subunit RAP80-like isoform X1 n=1 Tax=Sinocyclocheilus rhinocerous TaxID=307959 RepID=UPI0007BA7C0C|nr:PREDICTED: BRCA1-A complex subunit RAP80-like isoform X1 [Sinocyclocheilus rhinocerous]
MPRRKRAADEGGRRAKVSRVEHNDEETLVISDSEHEEEEDCSFKRSTRTARWKQRENQSHLQKMTEEEMLDLAMRLSAQEANSAAQRQELEDNDIQKAIEESLNESTVKALEDQDEAASSTDHPQQNVTNAISHLRQKLSFSSRDQTHSENETTSPLPEMPDLSQTTSSHLSMRSSPAQVSSPPANTQDTTSDKQTVISNTPELFRSVSESQSQTSPVFTRHGCFIRQPVVCVEKLSQDLIPASIDSNFNMQDSAAASICADRSPSPKQEDSPLSKCPVFTQKDLKRKIYLPEDKDSRKNTNSSEDDTQISDEDTHLPTQVSQGLSTDPDTCLSPSTRSKLSSPKCVPKTSNEDVTVASKTPNLKQVKDQTTRNENVKSDNETAPNTWNEFASHMVLHLTDEDDGSEEVLSPSPVLHKNIFQPIKTELSPTQSCISPAIFTPNPSTQDTQMSRSVLEEGSRAFKGVEFKPSDCKPPHTSVEKGECTISYYWGVPFCPMGQNPDEYTRVILCQMEVYEKSLKEAQRELLRKADWGQPVFPGSSERPFGARRWKRHRAPQLSEDEEENEEEGEKENNRIEVEEEREEAKEESVVGSQEDAEGRQCETYVVLSSPETKDEQVEKNPFFSQEKSVTATLNKPFRKSAPWDTSDETQIQCSAEPEEEVAQNHKHCEEDEIICPETQMTQNSTPELMVTSPAQPQSRADSEVMEVEEGGGAPVVEEEMMEQESGPAEAAPLHIKRLECPMCSQLFPLGRIEVHAALCNGETDQQEEQSQVVARRKRTKRNFDETQQSGKSTQMEKCYMCQGFFTLQEYPEHVSLCIGKKDSRANQENGLLSALDRTERRQSGTDEPGPSDVSTTSNCGPADPVVMGTSESVDCLAMTSCTSNAFTPQSENTDCLIDSSKNSQRLSRMRKLKR